MTPGPAFIPVMFTSFLVAGKTAWHGHWAPIPEGAASGLYVWQPATDCTMAGWVRRRGRVNEELRAELRSRKQWLADLATKGFSLRGGCPALEIARVQEIERLLANEQARG